MMMDNKNILHQQHQTFLNRVETSLSITIFTGISYHVCAYAVVVSYLLLYMNHVQEKQYFSQ
jgi:hypothetical protein